MAVHDGVVDETFRDGLLGRDLRRLAKRSQLLDRLRKLGQLVNLGLTLINIKLNKQR
jgi:hypothetical protein